MEGSTEAVQMLLDYRANVAAVALNGQGCLHAASQEQGTEQCLKLLLLAGCLLDSVDEVGASPLTVAAMNGTAQCIEILLDNGASKDRQVTINHCIVGIMLGIVALNALM